MPTPGTNEIFENILENQNAYIRSGETARSALDTKVTNAMRQLVNDDTALSGIDTKVTNAMSQLDNDDSALTVIKDDVTSALAALNTLANREYGYTHEAIVTDDLEKDYQSIITEMPLLADVSAVGMLAVLKNGDTVTAQGNRLFINGEEVVNPNGYTFSGTNSQNGIEIVKIWYFNNNLSLDEQPSYSIYVTTIKDYGNTVSLDTSYIGTEFYNYGVYNYTVPDYTRVYYSEMSELQLSYLTNKRALESVYLPYLKIIPYGTASLNPGFMNDINLKNISFPVLQKIEGSNNAHPFRGVPNITVPETVLEISSNSFQNNARINLLCKNATFIANNWCFNTPTESFSMCSDWGASINIAAAANNRWSQLQFEELISVSGCLRNVGFVSAPNNNGDADYDSTTETYTRNETNTGAYNTAKYITFPSTNFSALSQELIDLAFSKGWKIQGG